MRDTGAEVEHEGDAYLIRCAVCGEIAERVNLNEALEIAARHDRDRPHADDITGNPF